MIRRNMWLLTFATLFMMLFTACGDDEPDDPEPPNEEELITTLNFTLTPDDGGDAVVFSFQDLDGDGGELPTLTEGVLTANTTYIGSVELLNELDDPAENITTEVEEEAEEHQFFYQSTVTGVMVEYDDTDVNGNPVGISSLLTTMDAATGTLTIVLRHEPNKDASGVSTGDITNAGGETDIEVTFNVEVQ